MRSYGLPYMGSKSRIAKKIIDFLPSATNFYDLFMGGGAMAHCAALSGKYKNVIGNDINPLVTQLYEDAAAGKYKDEKRWISREDFFRLKDTDGYVAVCWSFGNDMRSYMYGREIEPCKKVLHYAVVYGDYSLLNEFGIYPPPIKETDVQKRRMALMAWLRANGHDRKHREIQNLECLARLQNLEHLARLQNLECLAHLQNLEHISVHNTDYRNIKIKSDSVIYCDIPYETERKSDVKQNYMKYTLDYAAFYDWCERQTVPVFVSSYELPSDRFKCVWGTPLNSTLSATNNNRVMIERLYVPIRRAG